jgi:hypothetical protein
MPTEDVRYGEDRPPFPILPARPTQNGQGLLLQVTGPVHPHQYVHVDTVIPAEPHRPTGRGERGRGVEEDTGTEPENAGHTHHPVDLPHHTGYLCKARCRHLTSGQPCCQRCHLSATQSKESGGPLQSPRHQTLWRTTCNLNVEREGIVQHGYLGKGYNQGTHWHYCTARGGRPNTRWPYFHCRHPESSTGKRTQRSCSKSGSRKCPLGNLCTSACLCTAPRRSKQLLKNKAASTQRTGIHHRRLRGASRSRRKDTTEALANKT